MEKIKTDKMKMIEDLQERLNWYLNEASEDEYNEEEVRAIKNLLEVMDPEKPEELDESYYNADMAFERFKATLDIRMRIQDEMRRFLAGEVTLADYPDDDDEMVDDDTEDDSTSSDCDSLEALKGKKSAQKKTKTRTFFLSKGMHRGIMAATLVLALLVGGTVGAYAEKNGFFHWVKRDEEGMSIMTSPEGMDDNVEGNKYYYSLSEVPEEYREYIWEPEQVISGFDFIHYELLCSKNWNRIMAYYENVESDLRLGIACRIFNPGVEYYSQKYDTYDFLFVKEYEDDVLEFYVKENDDGTEYVVTFLYDNAQYIILGGIGLEEIEEIAKEYYNYIVKR